MPIGIKYKAGVSAQLKSAVILAGLNSYGTTEILETERSRDHTENILRNNKKFIQISNDRQKIIKVFGKKYLEPLKINVSGDPSAAAFFTALTLLNNKSSLKIKNVGLNPTRTGFFNILRKQGANIKIKNIKKRIMKLKETYLLKAHNKPIKASKEYYVNSTDEYPILFVIAGLTKGTLCLKA